MVKIMGLAITCYATCDGEAPSSDNEFYDWYKGDDLNEFMYNLYIERGIGEQGIEYFMAYLKLELPDVERLLFEYGGDEQIVEFCNKCRLMLGQCLNVYVNCDP